MKKHPVCDQLYTFLARRLKYILFFFFFCLPTCGRDERVQRAHFSGFQTFGFLGEVRVLFHSLERELFLWTKEKSQHRVRKSLLLCGDKLLRFYLLSGGIFVYIIERGSIWKIFMYITLHDIIGNIYGMTSMEQNENVLITSTLLLYIGTVAKSINT